MPAAWYISKIGGNVLVFRHFFQKISTVRHSLPLRIASRHRVFIYISAGFFGKTDHRVVKKSRFFLVPYYLCGFFLKKRLPESKKCEFFLDAIREALPAANSHTGYISKKIENGERFSKNFAIFLILPSATHHHRSRNPPTGYISKKIESGNDFSRKFLFFCTAPPKSHPPAAIYLSHRVYSQKIQKRVRFFGKIATLPRDISTASISFPTPVNKN